MKYAKTELGQQAFKQRSPSISARQRSLFILFDGSKTVEQVLASTTGLGAVDADVNALVALGFLAPVAGSAPVVNAVASATEAGETGQSHRSDMERYLEGKSLATQITAHLGLRGFRLNLSVESAATLQELIELLPKIEAAAGQAACRPLESALRG